MEKENLRPLPDNFQAVYDRLYSERTIILRNDDSSSRQVMQLIVPELVELYGSGSKDPIRVLINRSTLGVHECLVLANLFKFSPVPIYTTLIGAVALGPAFLLAGGTQGKRTAFPNSKISLSASYDLNLNVPHNHNLIYLNLRFNQELKKNLLSVCAKSTSYSEYELLSTMESRPILSPSDAINFGIIDHVVNVREENEKRVLRALDPCFDRRNHTFWFDR